MRGTGIFEFAKFDINCKFNEPQSIVFFGDVHRYAPGHCEKTWQEFKDEYATRQNTWFIGMGDYLDLMSASERSGFNAWKKHESSEATMEDWIGSLADDFYKECEFMRGRLIGLLEGNHHYRFSDGTTTATRFAKHIKTKYLGDMAIVRLSLKNGNSNTIISTNIALHHGIGSGRTTGSMFNSLDHMSRVIEGCSIYAMGDNHQRGGVPIERLALSDNSHGPLRLKDREVVLLRTGSFLRGYMKGKPSYVVDALFAPSNLGTIRVDITPTRQTIDGVDTNHIKLRVTA